MSLNVSAAIADSGSIRGRRGLRASCQTCTQDVAEVTGMLLRKVCREEDRTAGAPKTGKR
jgi:hypothetical protein